MASEMVSVIMMLGRSRWPSLLVELEKERQEDKQKERRQSGKYEVGGQGPCVMIATWYLGMY